MGAVFPYALYQKLKINIRKYKKINQEGGGMEIKIRNLTTEQLKRLDELAKENHLSRDKFISKIITNYLEEERFLTLHQTFFNNEVKEIIHQLQVSNHTIKQATQVISQGDTNGN